MLHATEAHTTPARRFQPPPSRDAAPRRRSREVTDAELVRALSEQDPDAPRLVVERFSPLVRGILRRAFGADDEIRDAEQEVFFCLFRQVATLRNPAALRPFVMGIALNTLLHERRRRRRRSLVKLEAEIAPSSAQHVPVDGTARYALVRFGRLLRQLRQRDRATFVLRFVHGMTVNEVAEELGVSQATARRSVSRAWSRVSLWASRDPFLAAYFTPGAALDLE